MGLAIFFASGLRGVSEMCVAVMWPTSPGLLDNNPEQIRNKLKISAYVLETT